MSFMSKRRTHWFFKLGYLSDVNWTSGTNYDFVTAVVSLEIMCVYACMFIKHILVETLQKRSVHGYTRDLNRSILI